MVEQLAATTAYLSFRDTVLPRRLDARPFGPQARRFQQPKDIGVELGVTIQNDVAQLATFGKRLSQLLDNPFRRWVKRNVEVQDSPASVLDHKKAIQQLNRNFRFDFSNRSFLVR